MFPFFKTKPFYNTLFFSVRMSFLEKRSADEWLALEEKEISTIIAQLDQFPKINKSLSGQINEFKNGLRALSLMKGKPKAVKLVENIHKRAEHLSKLLSDLNNIFVLITEESERLAKMEAHFAMNYYRVEVWSGNDKKAQVFHVNSKEPFSIGRGNVSGLGQYTSRKLLQLEFKKGFLLVTLIGVGPLVLRYPNFITKLDESNPQVSVPIDTVIDVVVRDNKDVFQFAGGLIS
jgi:hypothetical protein